MEQFIMGAIAMAVTAKTAAAPMTPMVRLRSRFARKLRYKTMELAFER